MVSPPNPPPSLHFCDATLQDNPALLFATQFQAVVPVFILESATQYSGAACYWAEDACEDWRMLSQTNHLRLDNFG